MDAQATHAYAAQSARNALGDQLTDLNMLEEGLQLNAQAAIADVAERLLAAGVDAHVARNAATQAVDEKLRAVVKCILGM